MCGIAGLLSKEANVSMDALLSLQSLLGHRGPDAQEIFISGSKQVGLVHTRLSIQDLSARAKQPMTTQEGRFTIVFNGEIYNFKKLREELQSSGEIFVSHSDTEVILKLYQRKKEKCVNDFVGMFAFSIWDEVEQECFFARDPFGIKPLYYLNEEKQFAFASESKALRNALNLKWQPDSRAIQSFLIKGSVAEPLSVDENIKLLPAGNYAFWRKGNMEPPVAYWSPVIPEKFPAHEFDSAVSTTREALLDSVRKHFVSDVEVGLFLSGGLDSTAILAMSRELGYLNLATYTVGFENLPDEIELARRTARYFGTKHHEIVLSAHAADSLLNGYLEAADQPTIDGFNVYVISKFAHEQGAKVVLSGLGGDELFGGYKTLRTVPQLFQMMQTPFGNTALYFFSSFMNVFQKKSKWRRLKEMAAKKNISIESVYAAYRGIFTFSDAKQILQDLKIECDANDLWRSGDANPDWGLPDQVDWLEWTVYLRDQLLRDADIFSMCFGLELRVPFVDSNLFDTIVQIPSSIRLNRKNLLKAAVPEIPEWILKQPKRGFLFPFSSWNILDRHFKSSKFQRMAQNYPDWYQKWALLQLDHLISKRK